MTKMIKASESYIAMTDRSFLSDIETMLICVDTNLAKEVNVMLTKDMMNSISISTKSMQ